MLIYKETEHIELEILINKRYRCIDLLLVTQCNFYLFTKCRSGDLIHIHLLVLSNKNCRPTFPTDTCTKLHHKFFWQVNSNDLLFLMTKANKEMRTYLLATNGREKNMIVKYT